MRAVLLIAFHFPPVQGSSGVQRTLRFAQNLPKFGWHPIVLSVDPRAYESRLAAPGNEVPENLEVHRAFGLDTARHLSLFGRYPRQLALPDRWATWRLRAVPMAMRIIRDRGVKAVWSTFPIATAHQIGIEVARRSRLPWIAEFRDPMWQGDYPPEPLMNDFWRRLETEIFAEAAAVVLTTPGAARTYRERFPQFDPSRLTLIENGYDEDTFRRAEEAQANAGKANSAPGAPVTLLHSGIVYRSERDPTQLFAAVAALKQKGAVTPSDLRIVFRASGDEAGYRRDVSAMGIDDIVRLEPPIDYLSALREMLAADGLLILQAANCNAQIPAKLYEYLRAKRPIVALTDPDGDTARTLEAAGTGLLARLNSQMEIESALVQAVNEIRTGTWRRATDETITRYSRDSQAGQFARLLETVTAA